ncbi:unnamed protein product [Ixodes hexagonus]
MNRTNVPSTSPSLPLFENFSITDVSKLYTQRLLLNYLSLNEKVLLFTSGTRTFFSRRNSVSQKFTEEGIILNNRLYITTSSRKSTRCSVMEFKCGNDYCISDNMACDGHNNCGDNSDEECGTARVTWQWFRGVLLYMPTVLVGFMVAITLILGIIYRMRRKNKETPPGPTTGFPPQAGEMSPAQAQTAQGTWQAAPGSLRQQPDVQGVPVNLDTWTQMRDNRPPAGLEGANYPRANPVVMTLSETSTPGITQFGPMVTLRDDGGHAGFSCLQQPFRAANAVVPPPNRTPLFRHSHPPLSLYDEQDPMASYPGFQMYGMGAPMGAGGMAIPMGTGGMGIPMGSAGPHQQMNRFPTFIIIEAVGDDSDSQEPVYPQGPAVQGGRLRQGSSSSGQDTVFPTLLIQRRHQQAEEEEHERARHHRHRRRARGSHGSPGKGAGARTPEVQPERHRTVAEPVVDQPTEEQAAVPMQEGKPEDHKDETKEVEQEQYKMPSPHIRAQLPKANNQTENTVMRIDAISTSATPSLRKVFVFGRPISAPSGKDSIKAEAIRRARSQWDDPLEMNREHNRVLYDLPSVSTYDYASVWSNSTGSEATPTTQPTTETDDSRATTLPRSSADGSDVYLLRPTVSMENVTLLDRLQRKMRKPLDDARR